MSYARTAVTRMTLDVSRPDLQRSETVTLGDTNRRWEVTLINGGAPFRLPPNWTAALTGIKPDGTGLLNGCSVADGKIVYDFAAGAEIATCAGSYPVQFDIWDEVGDLVASPKLFVNVLADVRPHAELDSEGQYTLIGDLIGRVNQTDADVDLLGETALAQGDDIAALKEKITTAGTVTIPADEWTDTLPKLAYPEQPVLAKGTVALLMPGNTASQNAARKAKITVQAETYGGGKIVVQREDGEAPTGNITLDYIIIKVDNPEAPPKAALIGVDAYGEGGGTASGVDEEAVKNIINSLLGNVANERQYSAKNPPPYPVTSVNGQEGTVNLPIPSEAADVKADPAGTAETMTAALRNEVNGKLADYDKSTAVNKKIGDHNVSTESHDDLRLELKRLADRLNAALNSDDTSLDDLKEIVAYIKSNKTLIDGVTASKVNVTDIVNNLTTNTANVPLSAAQGVALKLLIDSLEEIVEGKVTAEQVAAQIATALSGYPTTADMGQAISNATKNLAPKSSVPTKVSQLDNDSGFIDQHQSLDHLLPIQQGVSNAGKILVVGADGKLTLTDMPTGGAEIEGRIDEIDGKPVLVLEGNVPVGSYEAFFLMEDGSLAKLGDLTRVDTPAEPEPVTYIIKWVNYDGTVLETDTVTEGETPVYNGATPTKPADSSYTYAFKGWDKTVVAATADAIYTATYTSTAVQPAEPTNWIKISTDINNQPFGTNGIQTGARLSLSSGGLNTSAPGFNASGFIPVQDGDYLYLEGITISGEVTNEYITFYKSDRTTKVSNSNFGTYLGTVFKADGSGYSHTLTSATSSLYTNEVAYIRISSATLTANTVLRIKQNGEWL